MPIAITSDLDRKFALARFCHRKNDFSEFHPKNIAIASVLRSCETKQSSDNDKDPEIEGSRS